MMLAVAFLWSATLLLDKRALELASLQIHAFVLNAGVAVGGIGALALLGEVRDLRAVARPLGPAWRSRWRSAPSALALQLLRAARAAGGHRRDASSAASGGLSAVLLGRLIFAEPITLRKLAAVALMAAGVALILL